MEAAKEKLLQGSEFCFRSGRLYCESVNIKDLQATVERLYKSPFYVYSKAQLQKNISDYCTALNQSGLEHKLYYSVKANRNLELLRIISSSGCGATTVSGFEMQIAMQAGFPPSNILYNGNGKTMEEIEYAIRQGCMLNIDSQFDAAHILEVAKKLHKTARVLLRLNPDIDPNVHPYNTTGLQLSKFGIIDQHLSTVVEMVQSSPCVEVIGLHCHLGSTIDDLGVIASMCTYLLQKTRELRGKGFDSIRCINVGGGLSINYKREGGAVPTPAKLIAEIQKKLKGEKMQIILEPGRSVIGNTAILVTKVLGVKSSPSKTFVVTDGSMTEVIRPSLYSAYHHADLLDYTADTGHGDKTLLDIVGPVCESADFLAKDRLLTLPLEGSGLVICDVGAYCASAASNYNMRPRPAEILIDQDQWRLIRRPETFEDLLRTCVGI
ncbi:diaminopimelate decarboxylase 1 [Huso huso]|uniref:Diaminopimelate decarboxylase 1 n=1 Tax=Huso huso TaxID=61971 RepID=A0ABR0ZEB8_HUSHU